MNLLKEGKLGSMLLKNRIVMAPMGIDYIDPDYGFSQKSIDYYAARAKGGTGLIITGATLVTTEFEKPNSSFLLDNEDKLDRVKNLVESIHAFGARLCIQLSLGVGKIGHIGENNPSFSVEEIHRMIDAYGKSAA